MFGKEKIKELESENKRLTNINERLTESLDICNDYKEVGVLTVDIPLNLTKDKIDEILGMIQKRMDDETEKLGLDLDWIIMPGVVKSVQTITINVKKEEEQK